MLWHINMPPSPNPAQPLQTSPSSERRGDISHLIHTWWAPTVLSFAVSFCFFSPGLACSPSNPISQEQEKDTLSLLLWNWGRIWWLCVLPCLFGSRRVCLHCCCLFVGEISLSVLPCCQLGAVSNGCRTCNCLVKLNLVRWDHCLRALS